MTTTPEQPTELPADIPAVTLPGDLEAAPAPLPELPSSGRGLTPGGWPYATPDDHPLQYPAVSQQLAEKLEAVPVACGGKVQITATLAGGWANGPAVALPALPAGRSSWRVTATAQESHNGRAYLVTNLTSDPTTSWTPRVYDITAPTTAAGQATVEVSWTAVAV